MVSVPPFLRRSFLHGLAADRVEPGDRLAAVTIAYLALPILLFVVGWLRPSFAVALLALTIGCLLADRRRAGHLAPAPAEETPSAAPARHPPAAGGRTVWLTVISISLLWTSLSGIGGHGAQSGDYQKHNAVLHDLMTHDWPVRYDECSPTAEPDVCELVYYLAFYLPAAGVGKWGGWAVTNQALFLWGWLGTALSLAWVYLLLRARSPAWLLLFPWTGGLDHLGHLLVTRRLLSFSVVPEWWVGPLFIQFASTSSLLLWVPQHAFPGWLLTALLLYRWRERRSLFGSFWLLAVGLLWSPFVVAGLVPLLAALAARTWKSLLSWTDLLAAPVLAAVLGCYYLSSRAEILRGWIWELVERPDLWLRYGFFLLIEVGIYALLIGRAVPFGGREGRALWAAALVTLALLPLYRFGYWGDLTMRSSIPPLFLLWLGVFGVLAGVSVPRATRRRRALTGLAFAIGSLCAVSELSRPLGQDLVPRIPPGVAETSVPALPDWLRKHYWSDPDSFFFRVLARPASQPAPMDPA